MRQLERNVLVAGCAPLLANLAHRVGEGSVDARATWIPASSHRALDLLEAGMVHIAGLHLSDGKSRETNEHAVRRRFPGRRMLVVNLTRWRQGFVVAARNPLGIRDAADLLRPGVRVVGREPGTGADELFARLLAGGPGGQPDFSGPVAEGHLDVARRVHCGAADAGVAIESAALAWGLGFVPLVEERFDLVIPASIAETPPVSRFLDTLDDPGFRAEAASLPGYDTSISGHASTLEAGSVGS
jgi:molybdate-binding protein